jgi:hypothetical protein
VQPADAGGRDKVQPVGLTSIPGGLLVGAAWGVVLGLIVGLIRKNDVLAAWFEDVLVVLGATAVA